MTEAWEEEFDQLMENLELPESIELFYFTQSGYVSLTTRGAQSKVYSDVLSNSPYVSQGNIKQFGRRIY